jgi:hypothetical protein
MDLMLPPGDLLEVYAVDVGRFAVLYLPGPLRPDWILKGLTT